MANVGFTLGPQSKVDELIAAGTSAGAIEGTFYLTSDTNRLYIGKQDTSLAPVNEGVITVATIDDLPIFKDREEKTANAGRFYYVSTDNILCVYNGNEWVQINSNTYITKHTAAVSASNDVGTVTHTVTSNNNASQSASFTVTGKDGIKITGTGSALTITGDKYTLSNAAGTNTGEVDIKLDSANTSNDTKVTLKQGNNVTLTNDSTNKTVTIAAKDSTNASLTVENGIKDVTTKGFTVAVADSFGKTVSGTFSPVIKYGKTPVTVEFENGTATLDVYTKGEIDDTMKALNAMTYKGTIGTNSDGTEGSAGTTIPASGVSIGDTFLLCGDLKYGSVNLTKGTLLIARSSDGTEGSNGYIDASKLTYDIVESTNDTDTTYRLLNSTVANGAGFALTNSMNAAVGTIQVVPGANMTVSGKNSNDDPLTQTITVAHANTTRTESAITAEGQIPAESLIIQAVTGVTSDSAGHITGVETTKYTLTDTNASLSTPEVTTTAFTKSGTNVGNIKTKIALRNTLNNEISTGTAYVNIASSSLSITDNDTIGENSSSTTTRQGLQIDMVWGSFE
jgi:hypothetical protein